MIVGTANIDELALNAATIAEFQVDPVELGGVECFQLVAEMRNTAREPVLPAGLHPTIPPSVSIQVWNVGESPWGPFSMALVRVSCRSGVRARGFSTRAVVTTQASADGLGGVYGFPAVVGEVSLRRSYDGVDVEVERDGAQILAITALDPDPMGLNDVQYTGTLNLAQTPLGLRLVQVEAHHAATRVERVTARLSRFDGAAWGNALLDPYYVVAASVAVEEVTMPAVRFVCKPEELAFTGTEPVR
jgi:hypothetical protein